MTNKKIKIIIIIIFLGFFLFNFLTISTNIYNDYKSATSEIEIKEELETLSSKELEKLGIDDINNIQEETILKVKNRYLINSLIMSSILSLFLTIIEPILLWVILIAIYISQKKYRKLKLSTVDFSKDKIYYRDILKEYSPSVLAYIDDFNIDFKTSLLGDLLALEQRKLITTANMGINIITRETKESLPVTLEYVLNNIKDNKLNINSFTYFNMIVKEARSLNLLEDDKKVKRHLIKEFIISLIIYIIFMIAVIVLFSNIEIINTFNNTYLIFGIFGIVALLFIVLTYYPLTKFISLIILTIKLKKNNNIRTSKGEVVNWKLEGLKNFLKDFSLLNEKTKEELIVWQDYLIYSVIFKQNTKISEKYKNIINLS